jgi:Fic family protein
MFMGAVQYHYGKFPPEKLEWDKLIPLIGPASAALARYDGILNAVPNPNVLLSPLATQEAVLSSKIEGTVTTFTEVLQYEAEGAKSEKSPDEVADIKEVLNYRLAMRSAVQELKKLPLSQRVIKDAHRILLRGVRGENQAPGDYRKGPNWIGPPGCKIEEARFVPISADKLNDGMSAWEKFIHAEAPDRLVQLAVLHAEFEALHPFLDGNGRIGRMFVPLFLFNAGLLGRPTFYMSEFFERNRDEYYERLLAVSRDTSWTAWVAFFLTGLKAQAEENQAKARAILELYEGKKDWIADLTRSQYAMRTLDYLFRRPIFKSSDFTSQKGVPGPTAHRILKLLRDKGMFKVMREASGRRPAIYAFRELLNIVEGYDAF